MSLLHRLCCLSVKVAVVIVTNYLELVFPLLSTEAPEYLLLPAGAQSLVKNANTLVNSQNSLGLILIVEKNSSKNH